jgi:hypothetical protein
MVPLRGLSQTSLRDGRRSLAAPGAQRLSEMIRGYWSAAGFSSVETEIVSCTGTGEKPVYGVNQI